MKKEIFIIVIVFWIYLARFQGRSKESNLLRLFLVISGWILGSIGVVVKDTQRGNIIWGHPSAKTWLKRANFFSLSFSTSVFFTTSRLNTSDFSIFFLYFVLFSNKKYVFPKHLGEFNGHYCIWLECNRIQHSNFSLVESHLPGRLASSRIQNYFVSFFFRKINNK